MALGEIGDAAAVPRLLEARGDADADVRRAAAALEQIGDAAVPGLLRVLRDRESAVPGLLRALRDRESAVRRAAAEALRNLLPASPPRDREERRTWQKAMAAMQRIAWRERGTDLLTTVLERQAAWQAALDPWQDPLQPPPVPAWQP